MSYFHFAFKVKDIETTRKFYIDLLGCKEGRSTVNWIDFDFFGNQLSAHVSKDLPNLDFCGLVDGIKVPIPHFGCLLSPPQFYEIAEKLRNAKTTFLIPPYLRYQGQVGEQLTMFVFDLSGNPLEFKAFTDEKEVFVQ